jgi:hypothetical protein
MRRYGPFLLLLALLLATGAAAQTASDLSMPITGRQLADFVPVGYKILRHGKVTGDLNHDGRPDVAFALGQVEEEDTVRFQDDLPARQLFVLLGTPAGYKLVGQSMKAVWCKTCGSNGDPFAGLAIKRGVLLIKHDIGGSRGHSQTDKFRYQKGAFYLIGQTQEYGRHAPDCDKLPYPPRYDYHDTNFVTGEYEIIRTSEACQLIVKKHGRRKPAPLRRMTDYAVEP